MMHDKRDETGAWRTRSDAETRCYAARKATQTHEGKFTHERDAEKRRMPLSVTQYDAKLFKDRKVNRDAYRPSVGKERP